MNIGVVIPATAGREWNLRAVLDSLAVQTWEPGAVVVVDDGGEMDFDDVKRDYFDGITFVKLPKHRPGMEQPRNVGVRTLMTIGGISHAWFLDSDVVVEPTALEDLMCAQVLNLEDRILVAPYDWLPPGLRPEGPNDFFESARQIHNDPRAPSFDQHEPGEAVRNDLSAGLACFSGNLVWPIDEFVRVGGFWSEIHHGRCEDGELGLRAVAMDVPISFVREARGYHLHHKVNTALAVSRNARDVPMLNARHPWVEGADVFMVDRDGKAFDVRCSNCTEQIPTIGWWAHAAECIGTTELPVSS